MTPCLSPDEFVDLVDGILPAERRAHLLTCATCEAMAGDVGDALALAASAEVPEPPAFFWSSLNARVRAEIADTAATGGRAWLRWDVLVPIAGLAAIVVALASAVDRRVPVAPVTGPDVAVDALNRDATLADAGDDDALALMIELVGSLPEGAFDALGVTALPDLGDAATALSVDEQRALAALLTSALDRPTS